MKVKQQTSNAKPKMQQIKNPKIKKLKNSSSNVQIPKNSTSSTHTTSLPLTKKFINYEYYLTQLPVQLPPFLKKMVKNFKNPNLYLEKATLGSKNFKIFSFLNDISAPNKKMFDLKMKEMKEFCSRQANEIQAIFADSSIFDKNKMITINPSTNQFENLAQLRKSSSNSPLLLHPDFCNNGSQSITNLSTTSDDDMLEAAATFSTEAKRVISVNATNIKNDLKIKLQLFKPQIHNPSQFSRADSQSTIIPDSEQLTPTKSQLDIQDSLMQDYNLIQPILGIQDCQQQLKEPFLEKKLSADDSTDILSQYSSQNHNQNVNYNAQNAAAIDASLHDMNQFFQENQQANMSHNSQLHNQQDRFDLMNFENFNNDMIEAQKENQQIQNLLNSNTDQLNHFAYDDYLDFRKQQEQGISQIIICEDDCFWQKSQNQYKGMHQPNYYSFEQVCDI